MKWSFRIATIAGTQVRIHVTFFILLLFVVFMSLHTGEALSVALNSALFLCAMFLCVVMHEFGHVFAARAFGIHTPDITLLPIGGIARLERMPRNPWQELIVAIAGPAVNVAIAAVLGLSLGGLPTQDMLNRIGEPGMFLQKLMAWNIVMVVFNMVPAFPMDGGRVLRALLALVVDYERATRWAANVGQGIALVTVIGMVTSGHLNPLLLLIAVFIFMAAGQEAAAVSQQEATRGLRVRDAMLTDYHTLPRQARLQDAVDLLLSGTQHDFPIVDGGGRLLGLLPRQQLIAGLSEHGPAHVAADMMVTFDVPATPGMPLAEALERLHHASCPALPVVDSVSGALVGLLTSENVGEMLMVRAALRQGGRHLRTVAA